jgi:hypothetical protein
MENKINENEYLLLSNSELESLLIDITNEYNEYQNVLYEAYSNMTLLSNKYEIIKQLLDKRNGRKSTTD